MEFEECSRSKIMAVFRGLPVRRRQNKSRSIFLEHWRQQFRSYRLECENGPTASSPSFVCVCVCVCLCACVRSCVCVCKYLIFRHSEKGDHWTSDVELWCSGPLPCSVVMQNSTAELVVRILILLTRYAQDTRVAGKGFHPFIHPTAAVNRALYF
jgi:hypothetical protein